MRSKYVLYFRKMQLYLCWRLAPISIFFQMEWIWTVQKISVQSIWTDNKAFQLTSIIHTANKVFYLTSKLTRNNLNWLRFILTIKYLNWQESIWIWSNYVNILQEYKFENGVFSHFDHKYWENVSHNIIKV